MCFLILINLLQKLRLLLLRRPKAILVTLFVLYLVYGLSLIKEEQDNRNASLTGWDREKSLNVGHYLYSTPAKAAIVPRDLCHKKPFLLILVCSSVNNFKQRRSIRNTWGNTTGFNYPEFVKQHGHLKGQYLDILPERRKRYAEYLSGQGESMTASVRLVFVVGQGKLSSTRKGEAVTKEAEEYHDIIQYNFQDTYNNLTIKTLLMFRHISQSCLNSSAFILKCDDDTFVNVPNLLHFLLGGTIPLYNDTVEYYDRSTFLVTSPKSRMNATVGVMYGNLFCNMVPHRKPSSKWFMPSYMYPSDEYPNYLSGAGYLLSIDVVQQLYEASLKMKLVYLEDVYITGLCAQRAKIKIHHHPCFNGGPEKKLCAFKGSITQHEMQDDSMAKAWNHVSNYSIKCPPPGRYFGLQRLQLRSGCY